MMMALSFYLLLLLVAHSVSAFHKERHSLCHIYTVHYRPSQNSSLSNTEFTVAVLLDGEQTDLYSGGVSEQMSRGEEQTFQNEYRMFIHLLKISTNGLDDLTKRSGCEVERSSSGDVTLLNTTAEYRLNGNVFLRFNGDKDQWEAVDKTFLPVKTVWDYSPHFIQITKDYLLQECMERLLIYLKQDEDYEVSYSGLGLYDYDEIENRVACASVTENRVNVVFLVLSCIVIGCIVWMAVAYYMITKGKLVKPPVKDVCTEDLNESLVNSEQHSQILTSSSPLVVLVNEDQGGGDEDQPEKKFTRSMDILLPTLAEDDDDSNDGQKLGEDGLAQAAGLTTAGGQLSSRTVSLPVFVISQQHTSLQTREEEEGDRRTETKPQDSLLLAVLRRWNSKNISLPNLASERSDCSDSQ